MASTRGEESDSHRSKAPRQRASQSLRSISRMVCSRMCTGLITNYNAVATRLINDLRAGAEEKDRVDEKSVRRRVYDVFNVLFALDIIEKVPWNKHVRWNGYRHVVFKRSPDLQRQQERCMALHARVEEKLRTFLARQRHYASLKAILDRNRAKGNDASDKLPLPFVILQSAANANIECQISVDSTRVDCEFSDSVQVLEDVKVLEQIARASCNVAWPEGDTSSAKRSVPMTPMQAGRSMGNSPSAVLI